jgi:hypothetical protein
MRKTRKYKRRKRKRTRKKRGGMDDYDIDAPPLMRSSSAPSGTIATEDMLDKKELADQQEWEKEMGEFNTPRAKDEDKAILLQKPRPRRRPGWGDVIKATTNFAWIVTGGPNRGGGKPAMAGETVCVWYGDGNKSTAVDKCSIELMRPDDPLNDKIHPIAYKIKTSWGIPVGLDLWTISAKTIKKKHNMFNHSLIKPVDLTIPSGTYDVYYILYEEKCGHGGERFELMKLTKVNIINEGNQLKIPGNKKGYSNWNDPMSIKQNGTNLQFYWGKKSQVLPVGSMFAIPARRHSIGGKRKRRRKRRTKKRRKKSGRKRRTRRRK